MHPLANEGGVQFMFDELHQTKGPVQQLQNQTNPSEEHSLAEIALATGLCLPSASEAAPRVLDGCIQPFDPGPLLTKQVLLAALRELAEEHDRMLPEQAGFAAHGEGGSGSAECCSGCCLVVVRSAAQKTAALWFLP
jgi:hypothetical protein